MHSPSTHSPPQVLPTVHTIPASSRYITGSMLGSELQGWLRRDANRHEDQEAAQGDGQARLALAGCRNQSQDADVS